MVTHGLYCCVVDRFPIIHMSTHDADAAPTLTVSTTAAPTSLPPPPTRPPPLPTLQALYDATHHDHGGQVADYIPQLAEVNPDLYGIAFCDVHGRVTGLGDAQRPFCLQSCSKPLSYCLARQCHRDAHTEDKVHQHVGYEPSGRAFNAFALNRDGLPHNPLINAGAMMVASLLYPDEEPATRFAAVQAFYERLAGHYRPIGFDNGVFLSEKHHADRNISLAYYMREHQAYAGYPTPSQLQDHLDLYYQCCAVTVTCETAAVMAATLAHRGVCPLNGETVIAADIVDDTLSIMYGCGMYDFSGQFGFQVGLPAKSGVSGCVMLVVPGVGGYCVWSPRLDALGNSVRGLAFCHAFTSLTRRRYHLFARATSGAHDEQADDPQQELHRLVFAASRGNLATLRAASSTDLLHQADYDGRTPLHLACAEGHAAVVRYLALEVGVDTLCKDRWGNTPLHEATKWRRKLVGMEGDASAVAAWDEASAWLQPGSGFLNSPTEG